MHQLRPVHHPRLRRARGLCYISVVVVPVEAVPVCVKNRGANIKLLSAL